MNLDPRALVVAALGLLVLAGCAARPPLSQLTPLEQEARLAGDRDAVHVYRAGLQAVLAYVEAQPELFPVARPAVPRLLGRADREAVRAVWGRTLDYLLALDSVGKYHHALDGLEPGVRAQSVQVAHAAFVAQYRFSLELLDRFARDPGLDAVLDEAVPELGLPAGTYARLKLRFLNVARATEFVALRVLDAQPSGHAPDLRAGIEEDRRRIWQTGQGRGELLTAQNAWAIVRRAGFAGWFPVQAGVAQWMAHRQLWRPGRALISSSQLETLPSRLAPGDILLVRRNWYLSDIGLPGFWPHAALYIGIPEDRRRLGAAPAVEAWVRTQGQGDGDLEGLLAARYPEAYVRALTAADGRARRVLEAVSAGVIFSSLEHLAADSLAVLRPRVPAADRAAALLRAFGYAGRPYDFDFDFRTDAAIVCTELVYKAYEPGPGFAGLRLDVPILLGRPVMPANEFARQFDEAFGSDRQQLDLVLFLEGQERARQAIEHSVDQFRRSWRRPKWRFLIED